MKTKTKHIVELSKGERKHLHTIIHTGIHKARTIARAHALLLSDEGMSKNSCAERLHISHNVIQRVRDRYRAGGLVYALAEEPRSGQPKKLNDKAETYLIALACTDPPEGAHHWTLELLRERMVKDKKVKRISSVAIMHYLHRNDLKPWREKNVVYSEAHAGVH
jgi:transposase